MKPDRVSPCCFAFASSRAKTRLGSVIFTRSISSDSSAGSMSTHYPKLDRARAHPPKSPSLSVRLREPKIEKPANKSVRALAMLTLLDNPLASSDRSGNPSASQGDYPAHQQAKDRISWSRRSNYRSAQSPQDNSLRHA